MGFEADLRDRAIEAGVAEFHWGEVPQGTALPYAVATTISDPRPAHLKGFMGGRTTRVQVDCYALTSKAAREMAEALVTTLSVPATQGGTRFGWSQAAGPIDRSQDVGGKTIHNLMIEFAVFHRQI